MYFNYEEELILCKGGAHELPLTFHLWRLTSLSLNFASQPKERFLNKVQYNSTSDYHLFLSITEGAVFTRTFTVKVKARGHCSTLHG